MNITEQAENLVANLKLKGSVNITGQREEVAGRNELVFDEMEAILSRDNVDFGNSRSEGRFWVNK